MNKEELEESFHNNKLKTISVDWVDAETNDGWVIVTKEVEDGWEKKATIRSTGLWIRLNDSYIVLAGDCGSGLNDAETYNRIIKIPRQWAVELKVL